MNNKKSVLIIVTVVLSAIVLISGSTYAYWKYHFVNEYQTNVAFTVTSNFSCSASGGGNITNNEVELAPTYCTGSDYILKREITTNVTNTGNSDIEFDLWLDIKNISSGLSGTENLRYAVSDSANWCNSGNLISSGTFYNASNNGKVHILNNDLYQVGGTNSKTYWLYIWLDYPEEEDTTMDQQFHFELGGECGESRENVPNAPELVDGLIPVKISPSGDTVTTVSEDDPTWYDYSNQKWANAVLVTAKGDGLRDYYQNNSGVNISINDIYAYYVWIPRYSYKVWQYSGNSALGQEQSIDIKFVDVRTINVASKNGDWHTHSAFWWDDDSDGAREASEELAGIWVGKFETSHISSRTDTASRLSCTAASCDAEVYNNARILPNVRPLTNNTVSVFYNISRKMQTSGNMFGLSSGDSHMIKNRDWGAVAYLAHSEYGIDTNVRTNGTYDYVSGEDTISYVTGCGVIGNSNFGTHSCDIRYGNEASGIYPQSTTGNVTGIFDMSGGTSEYVMGVYNQTRGSSGFNTTNNLLPDLKYYDNYPNPPFTVSSGLANITTCPFEYCGGHALHETKAWYGSLGRFATGTIPWFVRGGGFADVEDPIGSIFEVSVNNGSRYDALSSRFVLTPEPYIEKEPPASSGGAPGSKSKG